MYYLLGHPLGHSFSPRLHALLGLDRYALKDLDWEEARRFVLTGEWEGLNVTIPYKRKIMPLMDEISEEARLAGAVNTVIRTGGRLIGHNTDLAGFLALADQSGVALKGKRAVILGTGGTAHTAAAALRQRGAAGITMISRTRPPTYEDLKTMGQTQVLVNATPVGMNPDMDGLSCPLDLFPNLEGVLDAVYNPIKTRLILEAEKRGLPCGGGLGMLLYQGVYAQEIFLGRRFTPGETGGAYFRLLREKTNIVLCGMPGAGKSTLARILGGWLRRPILDTDDMVAERTGRCAAAWIEEDGEAAFRDREEEAVKEAAKQSGVIIALGGGGVTREDNVRRLRQGGRVYRIRRPLRDLETEGRPLSREIVGLQMLLKEREALYAAAADMAVDNTRRPEDAAAEIREDFLCGSW